MMVNIMTETKPTYTTEPTPQVAARRRLLTYAALADADAAERGLLRLVAYITERRNLLSLGSLDDDALAAVRRQLGDLRQCAEALGVGL